jgi:hypothetical protein
LIIINEATLALAFLFIYNLLCVQVPALPVSGVAQPSLFGIRAVLNRVFGRPNRIEQVVWCNLREEPVIYINARPFVLREFDHPFSNLTAYKGRSPPLRELRLVCRVCRVCRAPCAVLLK